MLNVATFRPMAVSPSARRSARRSPIAGHPYLAIPAAMLAGVTSGFVTAFLQTKMGVNSLLAGIIVNTALYSVNIAVMGGASVLNMNKTQTVFTKMRALLGESALAGQ